MNTYVVVLTNGKQITIKANDFDRNDIRTCFKVDKGDEFWRVATFINNNIAGFYMKEYGTNGEDVSNC